MAFQKFSPKLNDNTLPSFFAPILWSYDFAKIDAKKHIKTVIVNTINYGDLKHWRWISAHYGKDSVRQILETIPVTELRPRAGKLAALIFAIKNFNYASRGASPQK